MITTQQLLTICPKLGSKTDLWVSALNPAMAWADITTSIRTAAFIAQLAHESEEFASLVENLNYGSTGLLKTFPKYFNPTTAIDYNRDPRRIANRIYANRMGNGDEASGDGWKYRGRGPIQITGFENYNKYFTAFGESVNPDLLAMPVDGSMSAAWFWKTRGINSMADSGSFVKVTKAINGGTIGLESRLEYYRVAIGVLGE